MLWRTCRSPRCTLPSWVIRKAPSVSSTSALSFACRFSTTPLRLEQDPDAETIKIFHAKHARLLGDGPAYRENPLVGDIKICGLIRSIRKQKRAAFAHISDGSTLASLQAVLTPEQAAGLTNGAYVELQGKWQASPGASQSHELLVTHVKLVGPSEDNPIQKQHQTDEFLRGIPHLRMRTPFNALLARTRSHVVNAITDYMSSVDHKSAIQVHPPLITSSDCEGAGEVFTVAPRRLPPPTSDPAPNTSAASEPHYFRDPKYLTVSAQLHLEAYSAELGSVWALSPTFRAEESDTSRHLSEFYMLEAEFRDVGDLGAIMSEVKKLIKNIVRAVRADRSGRELLAYYADPRHRPEGAEPVDLEDRWNRLAVRPWRAVPYSVAIERLCDAYEADRSLFKYAPHWESGLQLEHEKWIVEHLGGGAPTFVKYYPQVLKPFYMSTSTPPEGSRAAAVAAVAAATEHHGPPTVACFDLLLPFGYCEVAGGSLREHRLEQLIANMRAKGLLKNTSIGRTSSSNSEPAGAIADDAAPTYPFLQPGEDLGQLRWYADLRRYGSSTHGGFGLGFDRLLAYLTGVANVRDVVAFPRTYGRAEC